MKSLAVGFLTLLVSHSAFAILPAAKGTQTWIFKSATCEDGTRINIIPFVEDFKMSLQVTRGAETNDVRKQATFGGCPEHMITTEFSYKDLNTRVSLDQKSQIGQMKGQKVIASNVNYDGLQTCGRWALSYFSKILYQVFNYTQLELERDYTYRIQDHSMQLTYKDARCSGALTLNFEGSDKP